MNSPTMFSPRRVTVDTHAIISWYPLPGAGILPVNSFLIRGEQPVLIDTGVSVLRSDFLRTLGTLVDLQDLRWIWLTHIDADHVGNLQAVLKEAPQATIITTFLGLGKLSLFQISPERVRLLNPGQRLDVGDRELIALRPPAFDAPETTGLMDTKTRVLFSSDCFGALLQEPKDTAGDIPAAALREGLISWAVIDSPWLHQVDSKLFRDTLSEYRSLDPDLILGSHLPPAAAMMDVLVGHLSDARTAPRFTGPDHEAFLQMMASSAA